MYDIVELVERVKKKDTLAMKVLYDNAAKAMLTLSYRITKDRGLSENILQDSLLNSFDKIGSLEEPKKYYSWLKRIVVNNSLKAVKKVRRYETVEEYIDIEVEQEANAAWFMGIPLTRIKEAIAELPNGCREVFTLYLFEEYKHREIAELLEISLSNSKSQYQYALKLLRKNLLKYKPSID